jgi:hypothetical protein
VPKLAAHPKHRECQHVARDPGASWSDGTESGANVSCASVTVAHILCLSETAHWLESQHCADPILKERPGFRFAPRSAMPFRAPSSRRRDSWVEVDRLDEQVHRDCRGQRGEAHAGPRQHV